MTTQFLTLIGPPAIAGAISAWLRDAKFPAWLDAIIAFLVVMLTALVWIAIGNKLTGNLIVDTMIITGYAAALIAGPMARLDQYLVVQWPSPFAWIAEALSPIPIEVPTPRTPPRLALPTTPDMIARNSLLANDPTWRPTVATPVTESRPLQVPSVDTVAPTTSQAATGPLPSNGTGNTPPSNGTQIPSADQGGQGNPGLPPTNPYTP